MFDIGFMELLVLAGLGLIVLGPERLPKVAVQLGRWVGQARRMSRTLMYQLRQEVNLDDPRPFSSRRKEPPRGKQTNTGKQQADSEKKESGSSEEETPDTADSERSKPSE